MKNYIYHLFFVLILFSSCFKEDEPVVLPPPGDGIVTTYNLGTNYEKVIWLQLSTGNYVEASYLDWDLAFQSHRDSFFVILNGGKNIFSYNSNDTVFNFPFSADTIKWQYDNPSGSRDSLAIGKWFEDSKSKNQVYLLDMGGNNTNTKYIRFRVLSANALEYVVEFSYANGEQYHKVTVPKKVDRNYVYLNLITAQAMPEWEPPMDSWDLVFTQYRHIYYDMNPIVPYLVRGVLLNPGYTQGAKIKKSDYADLNLEKVENTPLIFKQDLIGFDWKYFDLNNGIYSVEEDLYYLIKTSNGFWFKLRFIDYYGQDGSKGVPTFEYQGL